MRKVFISLYFVFALLLVSCNLNDKIYESRLEDVLGIEIIEEYEVLERSTRSAVGDHVEVFFIRFDSLKFIQLIERLNVDRFDESIDSNFLYLNKKNRQGDRISVVISLRDKTIKYTLADI